MENESVAGLNLNAPVKYNGVDVDKVHRIDLDLANPCSASSCLLTSNRARWERGHDSRF
jgi:hypothetical protein